MNSKWTVNSLQAENDLLHIDITLQTIQNLKFVAQCVSIINEPCWNLINSFFSVLLPSFF